MKRTKSFSVGVLTACIVALCAANGFAYFFTGESSMDNKFSNPDNWDTYPGSIASFNISVVNDSGPSTTLMNPALFDPNVNFSVHIGDVHSDSSHGAGMVYMAVEDGATFVHTWIYIGDPTEEGYGGTLTLRAGGTIKSKYTTAGRLKIGGDSSTQVGRMIVEKGALLFRSAYVDLNTYGELSFEFNEDSVCTLITGRTGSGDPNSLDGLLKLDLASLVAVGTYTLIDSSSSELQIGGALRTWLDAQGGDYTQTGDFSSSLLDVSNSGGREWTLRLDDGGQDLVFSTETLPNLLVSGDLGLSSEYEEEGVVLTPPDGETPAWIDFGASSFGRLVTDELELPENLPPNFEAGLTYRLHETPNPMGNFDLLIAFQDENGDTLSTTNVALNVSSVWDTVSLTAVPPVGAVTMTIQVGGDTGALDILQVTLTSEGMSAEEVVEFQDAQTRVEVPIQPALYLEPAPLSLQATQIQVFDSAVSFRTPPGEIFRVTPGTEESFLIDIGEVREVNFVRLRKHFNHVYTPEDFDLAVYTGGDTSITTAAESEEWATVASIRDDMGHSEKSFSFFTTQARFLKLTLLETTKSEAEADLNEILVGFQENAAVSGFSVQAQAGSNVLSWDDTLDVASWVDESTGGVDQISWAFNEAQGYYRIYRSMNTSDGFRCLNMEGEVVTNRYVDDGVIPGLTYYYKVVGFRAGMQMAETGVISVDAVAGSRPDVEEGLWNVSAGRFSLDEGIYYSDHIESHGNIGGITYGVSDRTLYLTVPSLGNKTDWGSFDVDGRVQAISLDDCLVLGSVVPGDAGTNAPNYQVLYSGWDGLTYKTVYDTGSEMDLYMGDLVPALTLDATASSLRLFGNRDIVGTPAPAYVAFSRAGSVEVHSLGAPVSLAGMDKSWLLFWWGDGNVSASAGIDFPVLVTLSEQPLQIEAMDGAMDLSFSASAGKISIMPVYGVTKVSTAGWSGGVSFDAIQRADDWSARLKSIPIRCRDTFSLEEENDRIRVELSYDYLDASDAWLTPAVQLAPVAPSTSYARSQGLPISYESTITDQDFDCYCGPYEAAEGTNRVAYWLPAPIDEIREGYMPEIMDSRTNLLAEVQAVLNAEAQVDYFEEYGAKTAFWRPRNFDRYMLPYITACQILSTNGQNTVEQFSTTYLEFNNYFDLDTYRVRRDRYSGRKYILSEDPNASVEEPMDYGFGAGGTLWGLYKYTATFDAWDYARSHWDSIIQYGTSFEAGTDWNLQAPAAQIFYSERAGNPDYLMSYLQGHLALARMGYALGDEKTYRRSVYQFARTFLTYYNSQTIQPWVLAHQPHDSPMWGDAPEAGYGSADIVRADGAVYRFVNSQSGNEAYVYRPFVRITPDIAVFLDRYMRGIIGKYLYHDLSVISPESINGHALLARAYLFDNDPETVRSWIDHAALIVADWGAVNHYEAFLAMINTPPCTLQPPDPQWVDSAYEARIAGEDQPRVMLDFDQTQISSTQMSSFAPLWSIGLNNNSGSEFSTETISSTALIEPLDSRIHVIGQSTADDWRYVQEGAWAIFGGGKAYDGNHHPRTISFQMTNPDAGNTYSLLVDIHRLASVYPLFMTADVNGHLQSVRCPLPFYGGYSKASTLNLSSDAGEAILNFLVPGAWLNDGTNTITLHVEGSAGVWYDAVGFGDAESVEGSDLRDADGDGMSDEQEFITGTDATDLESFFHLQAEASIGDDPAFSFSSVTGRLYSIYRRTNLVEGAWSLFGIQQSGTGEGIIITDTNEFKDVFYRVEAERPE